MPQEREGAITFKQNPVTLLGPELKTGETAPDFHVLANDLSPVTLKDIKDEPKLAKMELIRQSRLSVAPVRDDEWKRILEMAR